MDTFCCCCFITEDILFIHSFYLPLTVKAVFIPPHKRERIEYKKEAPTRGNSSRHSGHLCVMGLLKKRCLLWLWVVSLVFLYFFMFILLLLLLFLLVFWGVVVFFYFFFFFFFFWGGGGIFSDIFLQVHTTV